MQGLGGAALAVGGRASFTPFTAFTAFGPALPQNCRAPAGSVGGSGTPRHGRWRPE